MTPATERIPLALDCVIFGLQRFGGISNYWERLSEYAAHTQPESLDLLLPRKVVYQDFNADRLMRAHADRESLPAGVSRYLRAPSRPDTVFHTSYYRLPRSKVRKYVVTVYDFIYERYRSGLPRWVHNKQKLTSIRNADDVICISECTRADVLAFCPRVDPSKVHVVPLGIDPEVYFPEEREAPANTRRRVLFVGQRGAYKRFDLAVEAVRQSPDLVLGVVGPTLTQEEQAMLVDRLGSRWTAYGPVTTAQLRRLYSESFAFIFPSDYEGFGLPVLEAMACGCPVVASAAASLPEVGGPAASYASEQRPEQYASALAALQDAPNRTRRIADGLSRSQAYSWTRTFAQTFAIYDGLEHTSTLTREAGSQ